jgi:Carboxypeptidase regulatory-like domain/TonB-dependent Receptor Plug Domain
MPRKSHFSVTGVTNCFWGWGVMAKSQRVAIFSVFTFALLSASSLSAQIITGEITGTVTDQSGAAVPGAQVSAMCTATNATRGVTTSDAGFYRLTDLPVCLHKVTVTAQGFKTEFREANVQAGITLKADFRLQVGQKTETVMVEAAAPLVDFSMNNTTEVDTKAILDLPTEGRDFKSILALTPGVQRMPGGGFLDVSINGQRTTTNNYLIDGMPNNDRFYGSEVVGQPGLLGVPAALLGNDSIAEYSVQQLPSAEYGVKGGAAINVVLKSGTNDFHGALFYFGDYDWLNAKNFFSTTTTPYHNHNYGGTLGGPIIKNRTFFFVNFEAQRNKSLAPYVVGIPTQGDLAAALANFSSPATNPNGLPVNPAGLALLSYYPCSDTKGGIVSCAPGGTLSGAMSSANNAVATGGFPQTVALPDVNTLPASFLVKIDHKVNQKVNISGRYLYSDGTQSGPSFPFTIPPAHGNISSLGNGGFNSNVPTRVQLAGGTMTYAISPNKILDLRFSWSRYSQILDVANKVNPLSLGIDTGPLNPADFGVPPVYASSLAGGTAANIGGVQGYPLSTRPTQTYDTSAHMSWTHGAHTFKFGGNYQYAATFSLRNRARTEFSSFQGDFPTYLTQLLLGRIDEAARSFGDTSRHLLQPSMGLYFQDEWKVRPRLTVTYGLRWDINGALGDADKVSSNFYPCAAPEPSFCPPGGAPPGLVRVGVGNPRLYDLDLRDFGPRAGLAWDLFGNGKTALRIGYSMVYDVANFAAISAPYLYHGARTGAFTQTNLGIVSISNDTNATVSNVTPDDVLFEVTPSAATGASAVCAGGPTNAAATASDWVCFGPQPQIAGGSASTPWQTYGSNPTGTPPFNAFGTVSPLRTPRIQYYSLTLQHEVFTNNVISVGYYGSHATNMFLNRQLNLRPVGCWSDLINPATGNPYGQLTDIPGPNNPTNLDCRRPFDTVFQTNVNGTLVPTFQYVNQLTNDGYLRYNSLQVTYRQRDWHGLNSIVNFTWSNCIDTNSVNRGGANTLPIEMNPYVPGSNQGPCDTDIRRNFNTGITYDFPKWSALGRLGSGWQIGGVYTFLTGHPWTPLISTGTDNSGQDKSYQRPDCVQKPQYDFSNVNGFITNAGTAFVIPADGTIGTCGRNSLRGPNFNQFDFNVNKTTKLTEHLSFQLRLEIFNILNHPNFGPLPANTVLFSPASKGVIQGSSVASSPTLNVTPDVGSGNPFLSQGGPRAMQLGVKFIF